MKLQTCLVNRIKPYISDIDKKTADFYVKQFHYLKDSGTIATIRHALTIRNKIIGIAEWRPIGAIEMLIGAFGFKRTDSQNGFYELGRFVLSDNVKNRASYFLALSIKKIKKDKKPRALFTYADSKFHIGIIYQATNWKYYGLTSQKNDFYVNGKKMCRGKPKDKKGVWIPRSRKHRYLLVFDDSLEIRWKEQLYPKRKWSNVKTSVSQTEDGGSSPTLSHKNKESE